MSKGLSLCEQSTLWVYFFSQIGYHTRINTQIKIQEIWTALNVENYPLQLQKQSTKANYAIRACTNGRLIESGKSLFSGKTCIFFIRPPPELLPVLGSLER